MVDAQNQFGATVRADFVCTSTPNGDGTYAVTVDELEQRGNQVRQTTRSPHLNRGGGFVDSLLAQFVDGLDACGRPAV